MEVNNRQQRQRSQERSHERSQERSPETSPVMVPATQTYSSMFSCCFGMASDEPVVVPASNVTPDSIVKAPTRQSHVNNPDTNEHIICMSSLENPELHVLPAGAKRSNNTPQPGPSSSKKDRERVEDQDGRNKLNQGSSQELNQDKKIKFLINVPMWVPLPDNNRPQDQIESQVQSLLTLLEETGFKKEDEEHLKDVAVIIGLNGKHSTELKNKLLPRLIEKVEKTALRIKKISFTWGPDGDIKYKPKKKQPEIPYTHIREYLKSHKETEELVKELRGEDTNDLIYFSFIDADTVSFNQVYSSYLEMVRNYSHNHQGIPPTVMSTGYEFPEGKLKKASQVDNDIRIETAKSFPLGTYYPEPNFCVLLLKEEATITESFLGKSVTNESAILIRNVKKRTQFKAVFEQSKPIITSVPARFKVKSDGLTTNQSHYNPRVWATSAYIHGELTSTLEGQGRSGKLRGILMHLLTCSDDEFVDKCKDLPLIKDDGFNNLCDAAYKVREYRKKVREAMNQQYEKRLTEKRARQPET